MFMVAMSKDQRKAGPWFLDIGCSNHMTRHKNWLVKFDSIRKSKVRLVDNRILQAEGIENMVIRRNDSRYAIIDDVLFVLEIKCNVLVVGKFIEKGLYVILKNDAFKLYDPTNIFVLRSPLQRVRPSRH